MGLLNDLREKAVFLRDSGPNEEIADLLEDAASCIELLAGNGWIDQVTDLEQSLVIGKATIEALQDHARQLEYAMGKAVEDCDICGGMGASLCPRCTSFLSLIPPGLHRGIGQRMVSVDRIREVIDLYPCTCHMLTGAFKCARCFIADKLGIALQDKQGKDYAKPQE